MIELFLALITVFGFLNLCGILVIVVAILKES